MDESSTAGLRGSVVITSIAAPNDVMRRIAADCAELGLTFTVIGDTKSPDDFELEGCNFLSIADQEALPSRFAQICPTRHYARKNIGYLLSIANGDDFIVETDDDNMPKDQAFYRPLPLVIDAPVITDAGWVNIYQHFTSKPIWPRGLPLDLIHEPLPELPSPSSVRVPIQQSLADENPDVDAVYRLTMPLPFSFEESGNVVVGSGTWSPYNSQNTIHFREAFPLLYLPAYCSFRMTDIWRSFVAQRIAWTCGWGVLFRDATVTQDRNDHNLMKDFEDEVSGYLHNDDIVNGLAELPLEKGVENLGANLRLCYEMLVARGWVGEAELPLLDAWLADVAERSS